MGSIQPETSNSKVTRVPPAKTRAAKSRLLSRLNRYKWLPSPPSVKATETKPESGKQQPKHYCRSKPVERRCNETQRSSREQPIETTFSIKKSKGPRRRPVDEKKAAKQHFTDSLLTPATRMQRLLSQENYYEKLKKKKADAREANRKSKWRLVEPDASSDNSPCNVTDLNPKQRQ
ncbi:hypothetical protein KR093_002243 [Drosophila rubida]|uniref:Uncharacterized protein n=1 Tax=Drosophila rubida TaxID=30044 RepID=A0AAD4PNB5_9MUSC|nr:hypothetical protein KR093_002243 [Drosophila rubida]